MANRKRQRYEGHIWKHGNKFVYTFSIKNVPDRKSFDTQEEAITFACDFTAKKRKGRMPKGYSLRMENLFDLVLTDMRNNGRRSVADVKTRIDLHLKPRFEGMKVTDFRVSDVEDYKQERLKVDKDAPASINREIAILQRGFAIALQQELIDFAVHFTKLKERNTITRTFNAGEYETFRNHLPDDVGSAVDFQREVGWRMPSEVLTLEWNQIDFDEECVILPPYSTKDEKPRVFYFTNRMREILKQQRLRVDALQREHGLRIIPYVFVNDFGKSLFDVSTDKEGIKHVKPSIYFSKRWKQACEKSKLYRTTHDLRRTAAVERDNAGLSRKDNMLLGGWSTPAMLDRYLQKDPESIRAAVQKLDEFRKTFSKPSQNAKVISKKC